MDPLFPRMTQVSSREFGGRTHRYRARVSEKERYGRGSLNQGPESQRTAGVLVLQLVGLARTLLERLASSAAESNPMFSRGNARYLDSIVFWV